MIHLIKMLTYGLEYFGLYYGTYRGQVKSTDDPSGVGRIQVHCPTIHGSQYPDVWAMPITPMGGKSFGFWHIPDVGEWVHVRFDHGRLEHPMWEGGWWGNGDCTPDMNVNNVVLCTKEGLKLVFHRDTKQIEVTQKSGNVITIGDDSITLNHHSDVKILSQGNIEVTAQGKVSITAPEIDLTGAVKITGDVHLTGAGVIVPAPWSTPV